jgi:hypothetical protein
MSCALRELMNRSSLGLLVLLLVETACSSRPSALIETPDAPGQSDATITCPTSPSCTAPGTACDGESVVTCGVDGSGCLVALTETPCAPHETCSASGGGAACICTADSTCTAIGTACASPTQTESCALDQNGCLYVSSAPVDCPAPTTACVGGACACPEAVDVVCDGACTDTATDRANCGACGSACATNETCGSGACTCDPAYSPDPTTGVFVDGVGGNDTTGSGNAASPYASITKGIAAAHAAGVPNVYVAPGTYSESLAITDAPAGVVVEGGWTVSNGVWGQDCTATARDNTTLVGGAVAVTATAVQHASGFVHMTIESTTPATATNTDGTSSIGVLVSGDDSVVFLTDVAVTAANGGAGGAAAGGANGGNATGYGVPCSNGANGAAGATGSAAGSQGTFTATGFVSADGKTGAFGAAGNAGTSGGEGQYQALYTCSEGCGRCNVELSGGFYAATGYCGAAGNSGWPGTGGRGGGASVAVMVAGAGAALTLQNASLESGIGGSATTGGAGGVGGSPTNGAAASQLCELSQTENAACTSSSDCCDYGAFGTCEEDEAYCPAEVMVCAQGGTAGGRGGAGGAGGAGGGGAGGPSYALVTFGGAIANVDAATSLVHGAGGSGAGGGANGSGADRHDGP